MTDYDLWVKEINGGSSGIDPVLTLEDHKTLADVTSCWIPLGQISPQQEWTLEQSFHMRANTTNWPQGDTLTFDETFLARQTNDDTALPTDGGITGIWNETTKACE